MAIVQEQNVRTLSPRPEILDRVRLWAARFDDGQDEITLSRAGTKARIVICVGTFPPHSEKELRDELKAVDPDLNISIARRRNYGKFDTAHDAAEWLAFQ
jgi:hypothetical protein